MPSTELRAVLVALLVALAGCNGLPVGGDATSGGPSTHDVAFLATSTHAFNATVTITGPSGDRVLERSLTFDGERARYVDLTTLDGSGNYTLTIDTDLPAVGGGTMSANRTVRLGDGPKTTVVHANFQDISFVTGAATNTSKRTPVEYTWIGPKTAQLDIAVHQGNEAVLDVTVTQNGSRSGPDTAGNLQRTGVVWVAVSSNTSHGVNYRVVTVNESTSRITVMGVFDEEPPLITVQTSDGGFSRQSPGARIRG